MNNTIFVPMTGKQRKELIKAQQGELDAVLMYNALAEKAKLATATSSSPCLKINQPYT